MAGGAAMSVLEGPTREPEEDVLERAPSNVGLLGGDAPGRQRAHGRVAVGRVNDDPVGEAFDTLADAIDSLQRTVVLFCVEEAELDHLAGGVPADEFAWRALGHDPSAIHD